MTHLDFGKKVLNVVILRPTATEELHNSIKNSHVVVVAGFRWRLRPCDAPASDAVL